MDITLAAAIRRRVAMRPGGKQVREVRQDSAKCARPPDRTPRGAGFWYGHRNPDGAAMENPLIYIFDNFDAAERAREELIEFGFAAPAVNLEVRDDEAGPVQGNFTVGDNPAVAGGEAYKHSFANTTHRGLCMLTVAPANASQRDYAVGLLARYGLREGPGA
jgi:hypothetical protein